MKANGASGLLLSAFVYAIVLLFSVTDTVDAKRGCSAFGHSCFGGHGKRFDPNLRDITFHENDAATSDSNRETDAFRLNEFIVPEEKFRGQQEILLPEMRRQASTRLGPYTLSSIFRQWLTSRHRLRQPDMELNNK